MHCLQRITFQHSVARIVGELLDPINNEGRHLAIPTCGPSASALLDNDLRTLMTFLPLSQRFIASAGLAPSGPAFVVPSARSAPGPRHRRHHIATNRTNPVYAAVPLPEPVPPVRSGPRQVLESLYPVAVIREVDDLAVTDRLVNQVGAMTSLQITPRQLSKPFGTSEASPPCP